MTETELRVGNDIRVTREMAASVIQQWGVLDGAATRLAIESLHSVLLAARITAEPTGLTQDLQQLVAALTGEA